MKNFSDFCVFLWAVVDELWLTEKKEEERRKKEERGKKKNKMNIFSVWFLDGTKREANFEGSFALHKRSSFVWLALAGPC